MTVPLHRHSVAAQQYSIQRVALYLRQLRQHVITDVGDEIGQAGERQRDLARAAPTHQDAESLLPGDRGGLQRERRLTDTGLAFDHEAGRSCCRGREERGERL